MMCWHRLIKIDAKQNFYFHFTVESHENLGLISTLRKENGFLWLDCFTPMSSAACFDSVIESILKEIRNGHV